MADYPKPPDISRLDRLDGVGGAELKAWDGTPLKNDPVNHPSHYTSDPKKDRGIRYSYMYGTKDEDSTRNAVRTTHDSGADSASGRRPPESAMEVDLRLRDRSGVLRAQPDGRQDEELRMPEGRADQLQGCREDGQRGWLRIPPHSRTSEGEQAHGEGAGAHRGDGEDSREAPTAGRGSSPQERDSRGQPAREPGALEQEPTIGSESRGPDRVGNIDSSEIRTGALAGHDPVNAPAHYRSDPSGVECIQITRHRNFNIGSALKYLWRAGLKDDTKHIEDLKKARFYIDDEIRRLEN